MRIKEVIKEKGLTVKEVADLLEISSPALSNVINGNPTVEMLSRIANALNVPITELFEQPSADIIVCPKCGTKFKME